MFALGNAIQYLLIGNLIGYLIEIIQPEVIFGQGIHLSLIPSEVIHEGAIWQLVTHMFLHAPFPNFTHILFNMLALWMFGTSLEQVWGFRRFMTYYFVTGIGAGIITVLVALASGPIAMLTPNIGASGAIYGVLLAFAMLFPNQPIFIFFLPMPAKYAVILMGAISFFSGVTGFNPGVGHFAHLGGLVVGYLFIKWQGWGRRY